MKNVRTHVVILVIQTEADYTRAEVVNAAQLAVETDLRAGYDSHARVGISWPDTSILSEAMWPRTYVDAIDAADMDVIGTSHQFTNSQPDTHECARLARREGT